MARKPSARRQRDRLVLVEIERIYNNRQIGRGLYGARKVWDRLKKENALGAHPVIGHVGKGQVERIMKYAGLQGATSCCESTRHIGSTPNRSLNTLMNSTTKAVSGRAPERKNLRPLTRSDSLVSTRVTRVRVL
jgi:hypothetical protein